jgi:hypothetical protein
MFSAKFHGILLAVLGLSVLFIFHTASQSQSVTVKCINDAHCNKGTCLLVVDGAVNFYICCIDEPGAFNACAKSTSGSCSIRTNYTKCKNCFAGNATCPPPPCDQNKKLGSQDINLCL